MQFSTNFRRKMIKIKAAVIDRICWIILKFWKINVLFLYKIIEKLEIF